MRLIPLLILLSLAPAVARTQQADSAGISACHTVYELHASDPKLMVDRPVLALTVGPFPAHQPRHMPGDSLPLTWIVDTSGMIEMNTVQMAPDVDRVYRHELLASLPRWRFRPARVHGCLDPAYHRVVIMVGK